jgi:aryl carrier-like protein
MARWLADAGAGRLLLVGPAAETPAAERLAAELSGPGTTVTVAACDPADREALSTVIASVPDGQPLTGVVHAAPLAGDASADAAVNLDELTAGSDLSAFVVCSSAAGVVGGPDLGEHAAGHAFLDALAQRRRALGRPAMSVAWGPCGSARDDAPIDDPLEGPLRAWGMDAVDAGLAARVLERAGGPGEGTLVVAAVDWDRLLQSGSGGRGRLFQDIPEAAGTEAPADAGTGSALRERLAEASDGERADLLLDLVRTHAAALLGYSGPEEIDPETSLLDLGFSSFTALELTNRLNAAGVELATVAVFDHPTPAALARHLDDTIRPRQPQENRS